MTRAWRGEHGLAVAIYVRAGSVILGTLFILAILAVIR